MRLCLIVHTIDVSVMVLLVLHGKISNFDEENAVYCPETLTMKRLGLCHHALYQSSTIFSNLFLYRNFAMRQQIVRKTWSNSIHSDSG